jgi:hypothetical protein
LLTVSARPHIRYKTDFHLHVTPNAFERLHFISIDIAERKGSQSPPDRHHPLCRSQLFRQLANTGTFPPQ